MSKTRVSDTFDCENDTISELLSFLKSSFRSEDFNKAERILRSREEKMRHEKEAELKRCMMELKGKGIVGREAELMKELEVSRNKFSELCKEFEKKKMEFVAVEAKVGDLEFRNIAVEEELKEYKRNCNEMKERVTRVEEDRRVVWEREKRAQERIYVLSEELEMMEREGKEIKVQLKTEIRDLECGRRRAEEEVEVWKKKFGELESRICMLEEEATVLRCIEDHFCGKQSDECGSGLRDELSNEAQVRKDRNKASTSQSNGGLNGTGVGRFQINENMMNTDEHVPTFNEAQVRKDRNKASTSQPNGGLNGTGVGRLQINENMMNINEHVATSDIAGFNTRSPVVESRGKHIAGLPSIGMQRKSLVNVKEEINSTPLESVMDEHRVREQLTFELEGNSNRKLSPELDNLKTTSGDIIDITDSEDEADIAPKHASNLRDSEMVENEKEPSSRKCLKRLYSDHSCDENGSICEENPATSTPKRRRSNIVTSDSEDDDKIPISILKMKKLENMDELAHRTSGSPMKLRSQTLASGSDNVEKSVSPSGKRLLSLRQCEEKNSTAVNKCPSDTKYPNNLNMSDQKARSAPVENYNENVVLEEVGSDSEGESLGGFIVNGNYSSTDSEDEGDTDLGFNEVIAALRRKRDTKSKWQFEADMLSSFEEDPELCMKAVCALYRQQTSEEKSVKGCLTYNGRGFSKFDALRGSNLAEFLMDGVKDGDLKKSVEELKMHDSRGLEDCKKLASHYSKQLFTIYQNKEDPFFV